MNSWTRLETWTPFQFRTLTLSDAGRQTCDHNCFFLGYQIDKSVMPSTNALTATFFFIGAIVCDALTATEKSVDVPASLHGTSLTLVALFASPVLMRDQKFAIGAWLQRPILTALLFAAALAGQHTGGPMTRAFDAVFVTIVASAVAGLFNLGGVDETAKAASDPRKQRKSVAISSSMLAGSLLLYSNLRILRAGMRHSINVREFGVPAANSTAFVRGYAHSSDVATVASTFGGALGIGCAIVMVAHVKKLAEGTGAVSLQLGVAGVFQLLAAFVTTMSTGVQVTHLPALFGNESCQSTGDVCKVAALSRRFASTNTPTAGLWLSALGTLALAYPPALRLTTAADAARFQWSVTGLIFSMIAATVAFLAIVANNQFRSHVDFVLLLSLASLLWSSFVNTWSGSVFYIGAFIWDEILYVNEKGIAKALTHLTHVVLYVNCAFLILHILLVSLNTFWATRLGEKITGSVAVAGTSIATALFLASACVVAGYGGRIDTMDGLIDGPRDAAGFAFQHFIPLVVWAPIFTCRCEVNILSRTARALIWISSVLIVGIVYGVILAVIRSEMPAAAFFDEWAVAGALFGAGLLPWLAASIV